MHPSSPPTRLVPFYLLLIFLLNGCAGPVKLVTNEMPRLMVERLGWMEEVARVKQVKSLPVTDARRETELLAAMAAQGKAAGLPEQAVRDFFSGQIESAKQVQMEWLADHVQDDGLVSSQALPDLGTVVRPALDDLGRQMLMELVKAREEPDPTALIQEARKALKDAGYSSAVIQQAVGGLASALK